MVTVSLVLVVRGHHMESFTQEGEEVVVRTRRAAQTCRYKKGEWSQCDTLLMVSILHPLR